MRTEIEIHPDYTMLAEFVRTLPETFTGKGEVMFDRRNEIRLIEEKGLKLVVKHFKRLNALSRVSFTLTGITKAKMAYRNGVRLLGKGVNTPHPVGYIDTFEKGLLRGSYYVCLMTGYRPAAKLFTDPVSEAEEPLKAFARFTLQIQREGVFHEDYNLGNVFYLCSEGKYDFIMVDINRVRFYPYTYRKGIRNLRRLYLPDDRMNVIGEEYARAAGRDIENTLHDIYRCQNNFKRRTGFKSRLKKILRPAKNK